jgi:GrpB-like predicted nucleotidyltransferase (UPF0157 family)
MAAVVLVRYSEDWPAQFEEARAELLATFAPVVVAIEHIGSTSVPSLAAKPVIDVLLGADSLATVERSFPRLKRCGYEYVFEYESELPMRRYFVRPASGSSLRVNLHAVVQGSQFWLEHLAFRDALRASPALMLEYQDLKYDLASRFANDRSAYTAAKAPFIGAVVASLMSQSNGGG